MAQRGPRWGHGLAGFSRGGHSSVRIEMEGFGALIEDLRASAVLLPTAADQATAAGAAMTAELARMFHEPHKVTGATYDSITESQNPQDNSWEVSVGTLQGRLLEYGFLHTSGKWVIHPFITPASDIVIPLMFQIHDSIAGVVAAGAGLTSNVAISGPPQMAIPVTSAITSLRSRLYSFSRVAGDLRTIGIDLPGRQGILTTSRYLGDINSTVKGAIGHRLSARFSGSFATAGIRASVTASVTSSVGQSFPATSRGWNRVAGRVVGLSGNRALNPLL